MNVRKGVKNIVYSILGQAITMILGIVIPRLVIVSYGSEINGLLNSVSQVVGYLALLEAGVGAAALQALYRPISDDNRDEINSIVSATHHYYRKTGIIYFVITVIMSFVYPIVIKSELDYWFVAVIVMICGIPNVINYFFQGKLKIFLNAVGDSYILTNLQTITSVVASVTKIGLLIVGVNVVAVQSIYCVISLVQMAFIYVYTKRKYPWISIDAEPNSKALNQKNSTLVHQICMLVTNSTDVLLLSVFCDLKVASIYTVYNMVFSLIYNISNSVNGGIQFILGNAYCKGTKYYTKINNVYESFYLGLCAAFMAITYIMILPFLSIYTAGADINYIDKFIPILFVGVEMLRAMRSSSINTISVAGHFKQTRNFAIIESVINLVVSLATVCWIGVYGVLIGTVAAFAYRNIVSIHYSNKQILQRGDGFSIKVILANITTLAIIMLVFFNIEIFVKGYFEWIVCASIVTLAAFVLFLGVNAITSPTSFKMLFEYIKKKIKRSRK